MVPMSSRDEVSKAPRYRGAWFLLPFAMAIAGTLACNPDSRGGTPSPCTHPRSLPAPPGECIVVRQCSTRPEMRIRCVYIRATGETVCECNRPDGTKRTFTTDVGCDDQVAQGDVCEDDP